MTQRCVPLEQCQSASHTIEGVSISNEFVRQASPARAHLMFGGFLDRSRRSAELTAAIEQSFGAFVATIRRGEGMLYRDLPTRDLVLALWSATHGLALLAAAGQLEELDSKKAPEALAQRLVELLLAGLGSESGAPGS